MKRNSLSNVLAVCLFATAFAASAAQVYNKSFIVRPGDNGGKTITLRASKGDVFNVSFSPITGYAFSKKTQCNDAADLGWERTGDHSFTLTVPDKVQPESVHITGFYGEMIPTGGGATGTSDPEVEEPEPEPWNLDGKFKVLGEHEGIGNDLGRNPPANMVSVKPNQNNPPVIDDGAITWNATDNKFVGTIQGTDGPFMGKYSGTISISAETATAKELTADSGKKKCPEGDNVDVFFAYYGCDDTSGKGAQANPDVITLQTYTAQPELGQLQEKEKPLVEELTKAKAEVERLTRELDAAKKAAKAYEDKLNKDIKKAVTALVWVAQRNVNNKQAAYDRVKAEVDKYQATVDDLETKLALRAELVELIKKAENKLKQLEIDVKKARGAERIQLLNDIRELKSTIRKYRSELSKLNETTLKSALKNALTKLEDAQKRLDTAETALNKAKAELKDAKENAEAIVNGYKWVLKRKAELKKLKEAVTKLEGELAAAKAKVAEIEKKLLPIQKRIAELEALLKLWATCLVGLTAHEEEHRIICYHFLDKLTDILNKLRAWGYAVKKARAEDLGQKHLRKILVDLRTQVRKELDAMQDKFDALTGHGDDPSKWNRNTHLK